LKALFSVISQIMHTGKSRWGPIYALLLIDQENLRLWEYPALSNDHLLAPSGEPTSEHLALSSNDK
jgi:hypothetical protein